MIGLDFLLDTITRLAKRIDAVPTFQWGTVTFDEPLQVRLDNMDEPLPGSLDALVKPTIGRRVLVMLWNRRAIVVGALRGPDMPVMPDEVPAGYARIGGRLYATSGTIPIDRHPWALKIAPCYATTLYLRPPYTPPEGWFFTVSIAESDGFSFAEVSDTQLTKPNGLIRVRLLQIGSAQEDSISQITWHLTRL